ncbi:hypothetical protein DYY88_19135 [Leptolyngbya iicbica LK]|uniref:Uncharacterized protein n=2 Tax=Cyanophyceae TaxID=3028117 RepID=A0A4V2E1Y9_9CYAN|nr:hypothetical protein [Leptolyngbya sp. LK]RZM76011.1 hypothetical protein DYY88_19135 [Leptolyngbya sp. LK]
MSGALPQPAMRISPDEVGALFITVWKQTCDQMASAWYWQRLLLVHATSVIYGHEANDGDRDY